MAHTSNPVAAQSRPPSCRLPVQSGRVCRPLRGRPRVRAGDSERRFAGNETARANLASRGRQRLPWSATAPPKVRALTETLAPKRVALTDMAPEDGGVDADARTADRADGALGGVQGNDLPAGASSEASAA